MKIYIHNYNYSLHSLEYGQGSVIGPSLLWWPRSVTSSLGINHQIVIWQRSRSLRNLRDMELSHASPIDTFIQLSACHLENGQDSCVRTLWSTPKSTTTTTTKCCTVSPQKQRKLLWCSRCSLNPSLAHVMCWDRRWCIFQDLQPLSNILLTITVTSTVKLYFLARGSDVLLSVFL